MDPGLKRRLFIAVIIIALVVIFLPVPFGHLNFKSADTVSQTIPPAPQQSAAQPISTEQANAIIAGFTPINTNKASGTQNDEESS